MALTVEPTSLKEAFIARARQLSDEARPKNRSWFGSSWQRLGDL